LARIGIFGGTFNPIHFGHLRAAEEAREHFDLDRVIFIPSGTPPLKNQELVKIEHRLEMARIAVAGNPFFEVSPLESEGEGPSYSVKTVERLNTIYPSDRLYFMMGLDTFRELEKWYMPEKLVSLINFVVFSRPGSSFKDFFLSPYLRESDNPEKREFEIYALTHDVMECLELTLKSGRELLLFRTSGFEISSSYIRRLVRDGKSIRYLLPAGVISYIITNNLYR
jgi:nicotinate-nucleotide adenylyltransferase